MNLSDLPMPLADQANQAQQKLLALMARLAAEHLRGARIPEAPVELVIRLLLDPAHGWAPTESHVPLYRQLTTALADLCAETDAFQPGRVYCHRVHSAHCAEAVPPGSTSVFAGYSPTGVPEWKEFHQFVLDAGDSRVDALFAAPPRVISVTTLGRVLKSRMVATLGKTSRSYNVLGQVAAGHYPVPAPDGGRDKLAVTIQVVECRAPGGLFRLELNLVGITPSGELAADYAIQEHLPAVCRACQAGRRELLKIERAVRALPENASNEKRAALLGRIPAILGRMAEMLEQAGRQATRRTRHAQDRKDGKRPVQCAIDDALRVADSALLIDDPNTTVVVRGPRNRVHVFSFDARHVTTFSLQDDQIGLRKRKEKWRPATAAEAARFRAALAKQLPQRDES